MRILFGADENAIGVRDLVRTAVEGHGDAFIDLSAGDPAHPDYPDIACRAARLGERSRGTADPGATSFALIAEVLASAAAGAA